MLWSSCTSSMLTLEEQLYYAAIEAHHQRKAYDQLQRQLQERDVEIEALNIQLRKANEATAHKDSHVKHLLVTTSEEMRKNEALAVQLKGARALFGQFLRENTELRAAQNK